MHKYAILALLLLTACTTQQAPEQTTSQCKWPEIPSDGGCCRDLNENNICDAAEFAEQLEEQKQQEYEKKAEKARQTAEESGTLKRTIVNDLYDRAASVKNYRFVYKGDEVIVANGTVVRKLQDDYPLGRQNIDNREVRVFVNQAMLDFENKKASGECVPPEHLVRLNRGTVCDAVIGMRFEVPFEEFTLKMPIKWLEEFLHRTPFETLTNNRVGNLQTTLYRFTDLKDAKRITNLYVDEATKLPARAEIRQGEEKISETLYLDLYKLP